MLSREPILELKRIDVWVCSLSGCDKLSWVGAALGLVPLTQILDLDLSYIGETPPEDEDVATTRELQDGNGGIGYSTWVRAKTLSTDTIVSVTRDESLGFSDVLP